METVEDIIKEIRQISYNISVADEETLSRFRPVAALARIADRLDASYKRDLQAMVDASEIDMRTAMDEVERLQKENERLNAALKPVLDLPDRLFRNWFGRAFAAIRESRRIYNGGEK